MRLLERRMPTRRAYCLHVAQTPPPDASNVHGALPQCSAQVICARCPWDHGPRSRQTPAPHTMRTSTRKHRKPTRVRMRSFLRRERTSTGDGEARPHTRRPSDGATSGVPGARRTRRRHPGPRCSTVYKKPRFKRSPPTFKMPAGSVLDCCISCHPRAIHGRGSAPALAAGGTAQGWKPRTA
jgi:hypothetical protein